MSVTVITAPNELNSVYNDVLVELQREDFGISSINGTTLVLSGGGSSRLNTGDYVYIYGEDAGGNPETKYTTIASKTNDTTYTLSEGFSSVIASGYVNSDDVNEDYYIALLVGDEVYTKVVPDASGLATAYIQENLIYLLDAENNKNYSTKYSSDEVICTSFTLKYAEVYTQDQQALQTIGTYYCCFAALDYTDMSDYVIEPSGTPNTNFAKFMTEFTRSAYWNNQNFDVQIFSSWSSANLQVKEEKHLKDGTTSTDTYSLSDYSAKMNRIMLNGSYSGVSYINLYIYDTVRDRLTEKLRIDIYDECSNSLQVAWVNTLGGIDYWNFLIRQDYAIDINTDNTIVLEDEEFDLQKTARKKITVYADDISTNYQSGLEGLYYCLQAWAYIGGEYVKVRIAPGSFTLYRSDLDHFSIQCELILEKLNLGHL